MYSTMFQFVCMCVSVCVCVYILRTVCIQCANYVYQNVRCEYFVRCVCVCVCVCVVCMHLCVS